MTRLVLAWVFVAFVCYGNGARLPDGGVAPWQTLNDGNRMPTLGLGTWLGISDKGAIKKDENDEVTKAVEAAIYTGYRLIDTAAIYQTEEQVGRGVRNKIADGTVERQDLFVVTKLWNDRHAQADVVPALRESLAKLGLDYVDLYLIHWPMAYTKDQKVQDIDYLDTWKGMEEAKRLGLAKSIGISNFNKQQIKRLFANSEIKPAVLQVEVNVNLAQHSLLGLARDKGMAVMAYTPFGSLVASRAAKDAPPPRIDDAALVEIANHYGKTTPQVVIRYLLDRGVIPIPKSVTPSRIIENIDVFDFMLKPEETAVLDAYNRDYRTVRPEFWQKHPDYPFEKVENSTMANPLK